MGWAGDILGFEKFNAKDMLKKIGHQPWRLVTGVDPASTNLWNKALGTKGEPIVDQMGGAYGGHVLSAFGNKDGGVYGRAKEAGINTGPGGAMQDAAHVVAALYAGGQLNGGQGGSQYPMPGGGSEQADNGPQMENQRRQQEAAMRRRQMIAATLRDSGNQSFDPAGYV